MPPGRTPKLKHVVVRMRVSVDVAKWRELFGDEPGLEDVRRQVVKLVRESETAKAGAIVSARRDGV